jgi:hypothetical protein
MQGFAPYSNLQTFSLIALQDSGLGICPKSLLPLPNGDVVLGTFSSRLGYNFKVF